jgi:hypothetical protein|tara:strand:+ start:3053 stop:4012 length:960 start_codon:yes stop_codon:yes gene_type:complete
MSGRDVRRLAARAGTSTHEQKRNQITRIVLGACNSGADEVYLVREPYRIATGAVEHLAQGHVNLLDIDLSHTSADTMRSAELMREQGCTTLVVLGGDGTNRDVARSWPDAAIIPISTGTNNVFPVMIEAAAAGSAAGLIASGRIDLHEVARQCKLITVRTEDGVADLALVDAALLVDDFIGSLLPFDTTRIRQLVLARSEPTATGTSAIGGYLLPAGSDDDFGVEVNCGGSGKLALSVPISVGLYETVYVDSYLKMPLGKEAVWEGPGILALDGDREIELSKHQRASLTVARTGPWIIDVDRTMQLAAEEGVFLKTTES